MCIPPSQWNKMRGWDGGNRGGGESRQKTWLWLNCPLPFSIWMISLTWHLISLYSCSDNLTVNKPVSVFLFQSMHLNQVIVLFFKGAHAHTAVNKPELTAHATWPLLEVWVHNQLYWKCSRSLNLSAWTDDHPTPISPPSHTPLGSWLSVGSLGAASE